MADVPGYYVEITEDMIVEFVHEYTRSYDRIRAIASKSVGRFS